MTGSLQDRVARSLGYRFRDPDLLAMALTHPSYAAEHAGTEAYDRLEFLGDAVLGFLVADRTYRAFPEEPEGDLTRRKHSVVAGESLAQAADSLGIAELLRLGRGADAAGERVRSSVLENALEALVGAVYLDGGLEPATALVERIVAAAPDGKTSAQGDPKSLLQQLTQARWGVLPQYRVVSTDGPPHDRRFTVEVSVSGEVSGRGIGGSKQSAEKAAATAALEALEGGSGAR
ncbi:MAG TPA: ribonuclease III [Coriobacteriia bacterium]|nr:MAG: Ribonuclease 3 [Actinobacteria bacterium 66_15]HAL29128.1 ribonuclease III [Coriobacteriia bacterium]